MSVTWIEDEPGFWMASVENVPVWVRHERDGVPRYSFGFTLTKVVYPSSLPRALDRSERLSFGYEHIYPEPCKTLLDAQKKAEAFGKLVQAWIDELATKTVNQEEAATNAVPKSVLSSILPMDDAEIPF